MNEIMCYGDSNAWGYSPESRDRFPRDLRWTGVLQRVLGGGYAVIEEGQGGRTTVWDDPVEGQKNGKAYLVPCLESHAPLDLVVLMLGTNDLKKRFSVSAYDIAQSVAALLDIIQRSGAGRNNGAPKILLLAPPPLGKLTELAEMFDGGAEKSKKFGPYYREVAGRFGCSFLDTADVIRSSPLDGVHFEREEHLKLGQAVAALVKSIMEG
jgi:lysophospholipase L1-like esterase